jgi:small subunit ribosomal protein S9
MKGYDVYTIGRRKTSVARVYVKSGAGEIFVNDQAYNQYFGRATLQMIVRQPLELTGKKETYLIKINVAGGGKSGQAAACRHGIARALGLLDSGTRPTLKAEGFLTRDARQVERKKYGKHKARKRPQYSKR